MDRVYRYLVRFYTCIVVIHTSAGTNKRQNTGDTPSHHASSYVHLHPSPKLTTSPKEGWLVYSRRWWVVWMMSVTDLLRSRLLRAERCGWEAESVRSDGDGRVGEFGDTPEPVTYIFCSSPLWSIYMCWYHPCRGDMWVQLYTAAGAVHSGENKVSCPQCLVLYRARGSDLLNSGNRV